MVNNPLNFEEKILLILYYSKLNRSLITRCMKLIFLLEEVFNIKGSDALNFRSYKLGPYAENFKLSITPLINEEIIISNESSFTEYSFNKDKISEIIRVLMEEYINNKKHQDKIKLIKNLSNLYDQEHTNDLIQLCYFIKPEYATESIIYEDIEKSDTSYNQKRILLLIMYLNENYLLKLIESFDGILKIFNINEVSSEKDNFRLILEKVFNSMKEKSSLTYGTLANSIDNISIKDPKKSFKFLKYQLLEIISSKSSGITSFYEKKLFLFFFLNSLRFKWPLDYTSMKKFRTISKNFKKMFKVESYKEKLTPLEIDHEKLKEELDIYFLMKKDLYDQVQIAGTEEKFKSKKKKRFKLKNTEFYLEDEFSDEDDNEYIEIVEI